MSARTYFFGPFRLDGSRRVLYRGATPHVLSERLFQLLLALIEGDGEIVSREALSERVWGAEGVTDTNLTQHVYLLREFLEEKRGEPGYILTIPGRGYRFAAAISVIPSEVTALTSELSAAGTRIETCDVEALQQYCRGNYLIDRRTEPALRHAVAAFESALRVDPRCVPAYVGLARSWALLGEYWHLPTSVAMERARQSIDRAIELDPRSPIALAALSEVQLCGNWDWAHSRENLDAALTFDSKSALARNNAAWYFLYRGDFDNAAREAREALIGEPASLPLQLLHARVSLHSGECAAAAEAISRILATDPDFAIARRFLALAYLFGDQPQRAVEEIAASPSDPSEDAIFRLPLLVCALSKLGKRRQALQTYAKLRALSQERYVSSWILAVGAANCGRDDEALWLLRDAYRKRDSALLLLPILPLFTSLERRSDFAELRRSIAA